MSARSQMMASIQDKMCPQCAAEGTLLRGPRGGCSVNVLCAHCGTRYNLAYFRDQQLVDVEVTTPGPRQVPAMERKFFKEPI